MNVRELLFDDCIGHYLASSNQITVYPDAILSELGEKLFAETREATYADDDAKVIKYASLDACDSGFWEPNLTSIHYDKKKGTHFSFDNRILRGRDEDDNIISSGVIVFYDFFDAAHTCGWASDINKQSYFFSLAPYVPPKRYFGTA